MSRELYERLGKLFVVLGEYLFVFIWNWDLILYLINKMVEVEDVLDE